MKSNFLEMGLISKSDKFSKYCTLLGGFLLLFPLGFGVMWGNMSVYVFSRIWHDSGTTTGLQTPWVLSSFAVSWNIGFHVIGLIRKTDKRVLTGIGILAFNGPILACYFFVQSEKAPILFIVVGGIVGFGTAILDGMVSGYITEWSDQCRMGFDIFLAFSGRSLGVCVFNQLVTQYINPDNLSPTVKIGHIKLFTNEDIVNSVPFMFLVLGGATLVWQILGFLLLREKSSSKEASEKTSFDFGTAKNSADVQAIQNDKNPTESCLEATPTESDNSATLERDNDNDNISTIEESSFQERNRSAKLELLKSPALYTFWITYLCMEFTYIHQGNYFKEYGQQWIKDDHFLTNLTIFMGLSCGVLRMFWGSFVDKVGVKTSLVATMAMGGIFPFLVYFTAMVDRWLYLVSMTLFYCVRGTVTPIYFIAASLYFDKDRYSSNLGILTSGAAVANFIAPPTFSYLLKTFDWFSSFVSLSVFNTLALISLVIFLPEKGPH